MTGEGIVVKTDGKNAVVRIEKKSACSGECSSCGLCDNPVYDVEVINDKVSLYMPTSKVCASAFLVYMLPILAVFASMGICYLLKTPTYFTAAICIVVLAVWFFIIRRYSKKADLKSRIESIIENP